MCPNSLTLENNGLTNHIISNFSGKDDTDLPNLPEKASHLSLVNNGSFPDFKMKANFEILYQAL